MLAVPVPPLMAVPWSQVLRLMVGVQVTEEQLESIADRTVQEADEDGDGAVSFLEFTKVRMPLGPGELRAGVPSTDGHGKRSLKERGSQGMVGPWGWEGSWGHRGSESKSS